jgi:hypothetical protein
MLSILIKKTAASASIRCGRSFNLSDGGAFFYGSTTRARSNASTACRFEIILACHLRIIGRRLGPSVPCGSRAHLPRSVANPPGVFLTQCAAIPRLKPFSA